MSAKIQFRQHGNPQGSDLVFLHGYAGSVLHWEEYLPYLQDFKITILNLTHLYMGKEELTFSKQIDEVALFLKEHFKNSPVTLVGLSFGGAITWGLSIRYPELVKDVVLVNPMPPAAAERFAIPLLKTIFKRHPQQRFLYLFLRTPLGKLFLKKSSLVFRGAETEDHQRLEKITGRKLQFLTHVIYRFSWILKNENWREWENALQGFTHKCLFIFDKTDPLFRTSTYESLVDLIACNRIIPIKGLGHIPTKNDEARYIAKAMTEFLVEEQKIAV